MSNTEADPQIEVLETGQPCSNVEILSARDVPLGGPRAMSVSRTLPQRARSLVGAWCFADHYGPDNVADTGGMKVPRHPHTGLATVSWLFTGTIAHLDSAGNEAFVRPGELNLMIAGKGITHQEISTPSTDVLHGLQLWYAMPEETRFSDNEFVHYVPDPVDFDGGTVRVFIGSLMGSTSPVDTRTPDMVGAEFLLDAGARVEVSVRRDMELSVLAENNPVSVNGARAEHRQLAYVPVGSDTLVLEAGEQPVRAVLLGGVPLGEEIVMWWNFIGRSHEEIVEFRRRYQAELGFEPPHPEDVDKPKIFGDFPEGQPQPWPAPPLPNGRLHPRS